jgi:hypothetical protein
LDVLLLSAIAVRIHRHLPEPGSIAAKVKAAYMAEPVDQRKPLAREFFIQGITSDGKQFRPSDWAERLCGVMACFQPEGSGGHNARLQHSPYVRMVNLGNVKSVAVSEELRKIEPLAYHFVLNFAKDNDLQVVDVCLLPEPGAGA